VLYQNMMMGNDAYLVSFHHMTGFPRHRHPEIELSYCIKGSYDVILNGISYHLKEGDMAVVASMASHEFPQTTDPDCMALTIEVGPVLLASYFNLLLEGKTTEPIIDLNLPENRELRSLLDETAHLEKERTPFSRLMIKGNMYKIFAYVLKTVTDSQNTSDSMGSLNAVLNIETSFEIIYNHFHEDLKLDDVADRCGYSKSNFCKIFKKVTGDTFHHVLTGHRIQIACNLLRETSCSVEEIAALVGLTDAKNFSRVFKAKMGVSPGSYRKIQ